MLQWTGCWQRSRELKLSCDPSKESVWNKKPIRLSTFKITTVYLFPAQTTVNGGFYSPADCEHSLGGVSHRKMSLSDSLCLFCFLLSLVLRFSQIVSHSLLSDTESVSISSIRHLNEAPSSASFSSRLMLSPDMSGSSVWPDDFCIRAWLADGHWLDIHTVLNGVKRDTWIHAALFSAV